MYIRIRPENKKEKKVKNEGTGKHLENYDENSVTIGGGKMPSKKFDYPKAKLLYKSHVLSVTKLGIILFEMSIGKILHLTS